MTRIPYSFMFNSGRAIWKVRALHARYGPFVRLAPDIVSVSHPDALAHLQGHRKGKPENPKDDLVVWPMKDNIIGIDAEGHARLRRAMAHGFSAQASK